MLIDEWEPQEIEALVLQSSPDSLRTALNRSGFADYLWNTADGGHEHLERKQVGEILSGMEHVEYQLMAEFEKCRNLYLLVEGVVEPERDGVATFAASHNSRYYRPGRKYKLPYERYAGWLIGLYRAGVTVLHTSSWVGTAKLLILLEKSAQRPEHTTLQRHLKVPVFHRDPYVETLMGLAGGGIGPELGERLIALFHTPWDVYRQMPETLADNIPGIGIITARKILRAVGRTDI